MFPLLHLGPLTLQTPGLFILAAIWIGLSLSERYARQVGMDSGKIDNLALVALLAGVVGARLAYAAQNFSAFASNPFGLVSITPSMFDMPGGMLVATFAALIYGQHKRMAFWPVLDVLTPALSVIAVGLGLAHLASGDAFGAPAQIPWGIRLWGETRHPSQIYETLAALLIALAIWPWRKKGDSIPAGARFLVFIALSAALRIFLETFRGDSPILFGSLRTAQLIAWIVFAAALWLLGRVWRKSYKNTDPTGLEAGKV